MEYPFDKVTVADVLMQLNPKVSNTIMIYRIVDGVPVLKLEQMYLDFINDPVGLYLPAFVKDFNVERDEEDSHNDVINFYI